MLHVYEVITGDDKQIFAREVDAALFRDVVASIVSAANRGQIPRGYRLSVERRSAYGIQSAVLYNTTQEVLVDWISNVDLGTVPEGFEVGAVWPPGTPNVGQPIFSPAQIAGIQVQRARRKALLALTEVERAAVSGSMQNISDFFSPLS